jgi:hypothetical protein
MGSFLNITSGLDAVVGGTLISGDPADAAQATLTVQSIVLEIPTLGGWGLLVLSGLLGLFGLLTLKDRTRQTPSRR